ncbi:MAG: CBS domain-containing protein [Pseudomonadota bacterium]
MLARDVMVSPVITVGANTTVQGVAKILLDNRISAVPVVNNRGQIVGIVTESDLMHRVEAGTQRRYSWWRRAFAGDAELAADYTKTNATKVSDIMTCNVVTASPETPLFEIAALLERRQIKRVPIVEANGELVGIVSRSNLLQAVATARPSLKLHLPDAMIRRNVLEKLKQQSWTSTHRLNVTVANGIVELWGAVQSEQERKALRIVAEAVPGVTAVNDHLFNHPPTWQ